MLGRHSLWETDADEIVVKLALVPPEPRTRGQPLSGSALTVLLLASRFLLPPPFFLPTTRLVSRTFLTCLDHIEPELFMLPVEAPW